MAVSDDEQAWKAKYAKLANDFDGQRGLWENSEKVLCRAVVRLAMASHGLDASIDPHLIQVRDLVRKGVHDPALLQQLDTLTDALVRVERGGKRLDPSLLFQFLGYCATDEEEKSAVTQVRERYEASQFTDNTSLFVALLQVMSKRPAKSDQAPGVKGVLGKLFRSERGGREAIDVDVLRQKMIALLDSLDFPASEQSRAGRFKEHLAGMGPGNMEGMLDDLVGLLSAVKVSIQKEQQEIEEFLSGLASKLTELESQAGGVVAISSEAAREGAAMNSAFSGQMEELRSTAQGATDLSQLKGFLHDRLDSIVRQIESYREKENLRVVEMEKQMRGLTDRVQDMEQEAGDLHTKLRMAHTAALHDALTGLPNRGAYDERIKQEFLRWRRFGEPLAMVVWDIDHFKKINDRFGHRAGDRAIAIIGRELATSIRETDFIARYGGEEFVMLLTRTTANAALSVAESIRVKVKSCGFNAEGDPVPITVSCGISEFKDGDTPESAFERADQALYRAKSEGRDRCIVA